ncbi:SDR family oxidoreductase [Streptomyces sp. NPDC048484]|uniref:SDR family oxidoreductase n=1 Tax=Streptomyces sp. NPDC048484 TaxID=3155146 RepID=UPI00342DF674
MTTPTPLNVLVTGASGLVGAEVVARLVQAGHAVIAVLHSQPEIVRNNHRKLHTTALSSTLRPGTVATVRGDVTLPGLGLPAEVRARLLGCVERVVHTAAVTDFGRPPATYRKVNLQGTENVLRLAQDGVRGPIPLIHVSTAYVCGERPGPIREDELDVGQVFGTDYEESKFKAEVLLQTAAAGGIPVSVIRPSIVTGAERTGRIREFNNIYTVLKIFTEGKVNAIPGHYEATLDLVPVDYVAEVVTQVTTRFEEAAGKTFHTVGPAPHTLRDFSDVMAEYPSFHVPRYVPPSSFSADQLNELDRRYYEQVVSLYESFFRRRPVFDNKATVAFVGRSPAGGGRPYLRRILDYGVRARYLGAPLPGVAEILARLDSKTA